MWLTVVSPAADRLPGTHECKPAAPRRLVQGPARRELLQAPRHRTGGGCKCTRAPARFRRLTRARFFSCCSDRHRHGQGCVPAAEPQARRGSGRDDRRGQGEQVRNRVRRVHQQHWLARQLPELVGRHGTLVFYVLVRPVADRCIVVRTVWRVSDSRGWVLCGFVSVRVSWCISPCFVVVSCRSRLHVISVVVMNRLPRSVPCRPK